MWVKNLSRLISSQVTCYGRKKFICHQCLHFFLSQKKLDAQKIDCKKINVGRPILPYYGEDKIKFKNFSNKQKLPFSIYADLESTLTLINNYDDNDDDENDNNNDNVKSDGKKHQHKAFSIGYYLKSNYDQIQSLYKSSPSGSDAAKWFAKELQRLAKKFDHAFKKKYEIVLINRTREI